MSDSSKPTKLDYYKIAIETRNIEIGLFWQRSNYFLVLNTAIGIGYFAAQPGWHQSALSVFGAVVSVLWFSVILGSKYWQCRWEYRCHVLEKEFQADVNLFHTCRNVTDDDVIKSLERGVKPRGIKMLRNKLVLMKPSVSSMMTLLSIAFFFLWAVFFICPLKLHCSENAAVQAIIDLVCFGT